MEEKTFPDYCFIGKTNIYLWESSRSQERIPCNAGDSGDRFNPWARKIPWRRKWQPTPVFSPGEFHGQSSLASYSPQGRKEADKTDHSTEHRSQKNQISILRPFTKKLNILI